MRKRLVPVPFLAAALLLAGCGDRSLMLSVDIASYLDPALTDVSFGPVPVLPGGVASGEQALIADMTVHMLSSMGDVVDVENVELTMTTIASATTGDGVDTLRVYMSDTATDPRATAPVLTQVLHFAAGQSDTVQTTLGSDPRIAALFSDKSMRIALTTSLRGPAAGDSLNGRLRIRDLDAVVIAGRK